MKLTPENQERPLWGNNGWTEIWRVNGTLVTHLYMPSTSWMVKNLQCGRPEFNPWVRKIPWKRKCQPTRYFCLENSMDRGAWQTTVPEVAVRHDWATNTFTFTYAFRDSTFLHQWWHSSLPQQKVLVQGLNPDYKVRISWVYLLPWAYQHCHYLQNNHLWEWPVD